MKMTALPNWIKFCYQLKFNSIFLFAAAVVMHMTKPVDCPEIKK